MSYSNVRMKFILSKNDGGAWGDEADTESATPVLRSTEITLDGRIQPEEAALRKLTAREARATSVRTGDILVVKSSGSDAHLGKSGWVDERCVGMSFSNFIQRLRFSQDFDSRFAWYFMNCTAMKEQVRVLSSTTTGLQNLSGSLIRQIEVPHPPLEDQRRIADFLDAETARIDELAAARRRMRDLLVLRQERTIEKIIGLDGRPRMIPLKYVVQSVSVGIVITPANWYVDTGGVPALRGLNIQSDCVDNNNIIRISDEGHRQNMKSRLSAGDVVVVRTGQAGTAAVVPTEFDGCNCIDLLIIRPGKKANPSFVCHYLNSFYARDKIMEHSVGTIQSHFNVASMKNLEFPNIKLVEQQRRATRLDELVGELNLLNSRLGTQLELLIERRQALITAAVTGQIDVATARSVAV